jgi:hypothetical protein
MLWGLLEMMAPIPADVAVIAADVTPSAGALPTRVSSAAVASASIPSPSQEPAAIGASAATGPDTARPEEPSMESPVARQATGRGFAFHPSTPPLHAFRFALGGYWDAIDPQVMYGYNVRLPQVSLDARYGLGKGFSLGGHLNSMFVLNELTVGARFAHRADRWSLEGALNVGVYIGKLAQFGFDALLIAPEYKPEVTVGWDLGSIALSLRGSVIFMGPERARVGEVWGGFDNSNAFVGHSEMLYVENTTSSDSIWYFGAGVVTSRAYYALWLLFPDSPALFTYPRIVAGYEF